MATTTDDTMTVQIGDDPPVTLTPEQIDRAADRLRQRQLTFDVGKAGGSPDLASIKIAGSLPLWRDLKRQTVVHVTVTDEFGEVIVDSDAKITGVAFKDDEDKHGNITTERIHTATLGA